MAGTYQVRVYAEGYRQSRTEPFDVAESDDWDLGDVQLTPIPLSFTGATPCTDLPSEGGTCRFSVTVMNQWPTSIEAAA